MNLNKATLIGHVGKDPEVRNFQDGSEVAKFSIATAEYWKDKATGERKSKTEWHNVVVYNANLIKLVKQYVKKGSKLYIEGAIASRKYSNQQGVEQNVTEILIKQFNGTIGLLDGKEEREPKAVERPAFDDDIGHDDVPF